MVGSAGVAPWRCVCVFVCACARVCVRAHACMRACVCVLWMHVLHRLRPSGPGTGQPRAALAAGIGMVHQHFMPADNLTVLENIILGSEPARRGRIDFAEARARVTAIMASLSAELDIESAVSELGVGGRQRVEIVKVL